MKGMKKKESTLKPHQSNNTTTLAMTKKSSFYNKSIPRHNPPLNLLSTQWYLSLPPSLPPSFRSLSFSIIVDTPGHKPCAQIYFQSLHPPLGLSSPPVVPLGDSFLFRALYLSASTSRENRCRSPLPPSLPLPLSLSLPLSPSLCVCVSLFELVQACLLHR